MSQNPDHADDEIEEKIEVRTVKLTLAQRQELDRRIEDFKNDPSGNIPWETIKAEALARK